MAGRYVGEELESRCPMGRAVMDVTAAPLPDLVENHFTRMTGAMIAEIEDTMLETATDTDRRGGIDPDLVLEAVPETVVREAGATPVPGAAPGTVPDPILGREATVARAATKNAQDLDQLALDLDRIADLSKKTATRKISVTKGDFEHPRNSTECFSMS